MIESLMALYLTLFSDNFICKENRCYLIISGCVEGDNPQLHIEHGSCSIYSNFGKRTYEPDDYIPLRIFSVNEAWGMRG